MRQPGEQERRWEYRVHYRDGGAFGGACLTLAEVLKELRPLLESESVLRCEIKPYGPSSE